MPRHHCADFPTESFCNKLAKEQLPQAVLEVVVVVASTQFLAPRPTCLFDFLIQEQLHPSHLAAR
jgi:hypothetical protein